MSAAVIAAATAVLISLMNFVFFRLGEKERHAYENVLDLRRARRDVYARFARSALAIQFPASEDDRRMRDLIAIQAIFDTIQLIATLPVRKAADDYYAALTDAWKVCDAAASDKKVCDSAASRKKVCDAAESFLAAARSELGVVEEHGGRKRVQLWRRWLNLNDERKLGCPR